MRIGDFSVAIPQGIESDAYVSLPHNTQYSINIRNYLNRRCAAEVKVDGKVVGTFRINANDDLILERPTNDTGRFTFYQDGTSEARAAKLNKVSKQNRGVISVTFKPEKPQTVELVEETPYQPWKPWHPWDVRPIGSPDIRYESPGGQHVNSTARSYAKGLTANSVVMDFAGEPRSGGTGLSGSSGQRFRTVGNLDYDDKSTWITINLRLIVVNNSPRPLKDANVRSNTVPAPL